MENAWIEEQHVALEERQFIAFIGCISLKKVFFFIVVKFMKHKIYQFSHFKVTLSTFTLLCTHHRYSSPEHFLQPKMKLCTY